MVEEVSPGFLGVPPTTGHICFKYADSLEKLFEHWPQICFTILKLFRRSCSSSLLCFPKGLLQ